LNTAEIQKQSRPKGAASNSNLYFTLSNFLIDFEAAFGKQLFEPQLFEPQLLPNISVLSLVFTKVTNMIVNIVKQLSAQYSFYAFFIDLVWKYVSIVVDKFL